MLAASPCMGQAGSEQTPRRAQAVASLSVAPGVTPLLQRLRTWPQRHFGLLLALLLLQVVAYSYLFTLPILTDHTFPNSWLYPYPSFKTVGEGRWLADLVIALQGGSGVPAVQMLGAAVLQAANGILFASLLGVQRGPGRFVLAGLICLHPAFLDYYSFAADHLSFVLGDSCALLAAWCLLRAQGPLWRLLGASLFNLLALGLYGPKIALVLLLTLLVLLLRLVEAPAALASRGGLLREIGLVAGSLLLAVLLFALSARLLISQPILPGAHVNAPAEILTATLASYGKAKRYLLGMAGLPAGVLRGLPLLIVISGLVALALRLRRHCWTQQALAALAVLLLPVALNGPSIINSFSPTDRGRFVSAYAYLLVFCLAQTLRLRRLRLPVLALASLLLWLFFSLAVQQANAAQFKSSYDLTSINRILVRLEPLIEVHSGPSEQQPVLVVGRYPAFSLEPFVRWPGRTDAAHLLVNDTFAPYRQTEMLNHLLGRPLLRRPTAAEIEQVLPRIQGTPPWPAPASVFREGRTLVVVLEPWRPDVPLTWKLDP
jgi:hypothetical protein